VAEPPDALQGDVLESHVMVIGSSMTGSSLVTVIDTNGWLAITFMVACAVMA